MSCPECGEQMFQNSVTRRWWCWNHNCDVLWRYDDDNDEKQGVNTTAENP